jgi:hypothetical protein
MLHHYVINAVSESLSLTQLGTLQTSDSLASRLAANRLDSSRRRVGSDLQLAPASAAAVSLEREADGALPDGVSLQDAIQRNDGMQEEAYAWHRAALSKRRAEDEQDDTEHEDEDSKVLEVGLELPSSPTGASPLTALQCINQDQEEGPPQIVEPAKPSRPRVSEVSRGTPARRSGWSSRRALWPEKPPPEKLALLRRVNWRGELLPDLALPVMR